ncbi:MAG: sarcinarray family MAST domain-containing protein [Methanosarcina sp.]|uniref:sarcinarray family MAST domain-containing protein n=1 Tax=Methanosarcina sp. TaxID=2213 RepID=UPI0026093761|nr:sarcinarray family MAST domain-containing protein [Methanosarcina sp.]MDD3246594.1 sarcinarray family MAST domain-containing protein [Methanosarcina sp.]MDD4248156.1 sarcinarray family MAST domain-containing protein [Methanosarcina sp.]
MKSKVIIFGFFVMFLINTVSASSPYGSMDVYYNEKLLPGEEVAKPLLNIGEPFKIKIVMTLNQTSRLFIEVDSIGSEFPYEVIEGPSKFSEKKHFESLDPGVYTFEWILRANEGWEGWSMPVNFWYQIHEEGEDEPAVKGEFTVAYCTISNEHYKGEIPTSEDHPVSETEPSSKSASTPAFSLVTAISALVLVFLRFSRQ